MLPDLSPTHIILFVVLVLVVVGPKDLPMVLRKAGQWMAKIRGMANEFRASFDEMARQSELDELRKEVEAMRAAAGKPVDEMKGQFAGFMEPLINVTAEDTPAIADTVPAAEPEIGVMPPRGNVMKAEGSPVPKTPKSKTASKSKPSGDKASPAKAKPTAAAPKSKAASKPKAPAKKTKVPAGGSGQ